MDILLGLAFSTHVGLANEYNEFHPYIQLNQDNYFAGAYYNSEENISFYAGKEIKWDKLGVEFGIVTGYSAYEIPVAPMLRITYVLSEDHKFFVAPVYEVTENNSNAGFVFGLDFQIK